MGRCLVAVFATAVCLVPGAACSSPAPQAPATTATLTAAECDAIGINSAGLRTSWGDVAALGIGDPRPALPAGFAEQSLEVMTFEPIPLGCRQPESATPQFRAAFRSPGGDVLKMEAYPVNQPPIGPGHIGPGSVSWSGSRFWFQVTMRSGTPPGAPTMAALARALDPAFAADCLVHDYDITEADLAAAGIRPARPPAGYTVVRSGISRTELPSGCSGDYDGFYLASWEFQGPGGTRILASVERVDGAIYPAGGSADADTLRWSDTRALYGVRAHPEDAPPPPAAALLAVARSLDPTLDATALRRE